MKDKLKNYRPTTELVGKIDKLRAVKKVGVMSTITLSACILPALAIAQTAPLPSITNNSAQHTSSASGGYLSSNYEALSPKPNIGVMPSAQNDLNSPDKKDKSTAASSSVSSGKENKENLAARGKLSHHPTEPLLTPMELDTILEKYSIIGKKFSTNCDEASKSGGTTLCMKDLESYFENRNVRLRVLTYNTMSTMEFSMNRINFHLDEKNTIITVQVG